MDSPGDFANRISDGKESRFVRTRFRLPHGEARVRARREFQAYPIETYMTEIEAMKAVGSGYSFSGVVQKTPKAGEKGEEVPKGVFQLEEYRGLSALLCSRAEAANRPDKMGGDFQLAPNPHAAVPLPKGFRLRGVYFDAKAVGSGYEVRPT